MAKIYFVIIKWFADLGVVAKLSVIIITMGAIVTFVTWLLISNYKEQRLSDLETIKGLRLQLEVKDSFYQANQRRIDSIHTIEINNERLTNKAYVDQILKDQDKVIQWLKDEIKARK